MEKTEGMSICRRDPSTQVMAGTMLLCCADGEADKSCKQQQTSVGAMPDPLLGSHNSYCKSIRVMYSVKLLTVFLLACTEQ